MFSSLSSFLPSALQHIANPNQPPPPAFVPVDDGDDNNNNDDDDPRDPDPDPARPQSATGESSAKKTSKRGPNETFVFVRPRPAKTNHPLNLQVQLVPPTAPTRALRQSLDGAPLPTSASTVSLARTPSNWSDAPSYGSTASFASTTSTSTRHTIIPLYNLQAHNVMTNTIVDAGTDAKVAKFPKRGIELIDLVMLEPVEVWGSLNRTPGPALVRPTTPSDPAPGPGSSTTSLHSASHASVHSHTPSHQPPAPAPSEQHPPPPSKRSTIFSKIFKKQQQPNIERHCLGSFEICTWSPTGMI
ncbi:hypothetical protein LshimejAT787_1300630 [Lyophyllum shimeji]|uniref:Uncharacterized protein n=1 Tax=Lyophyllum shimeji TaxID=47721 RepID=A0A9P3PUJ3_LYOSH|nr:hypothetical protein LshimejAT787_1300630 [Lyophyllum shimeji]